MPKPTQKPPKHDETPAVTCITKEIADCMTREGIAMSIRLIFRQDNLLGSPAYWKLNGRTWDWLVDHVTELCKKPQFIREILPGVSQLCPDLLVYPKQTIAIVSLYGLLYFMRTVEIGPPPVPDPLPDLRSHPQVACPTENEFEQLKNIARQGEGE